MSNTTTATTTIQREKLVVPSQVVGLAKQNGKRIVKGFVADSSINLNGRGIKPEAIDKVMQTMLNKPYLLPPFLDHPQRPKPFPQDPNDDIALIHQTAKPYEAGVIYDYERVASETNPGYNAYIELTSPLAVNLFDEGILPRFLSMSIYKFDKNESDTEITNAVVNNICAVRNPAYGAKARILGMCVGDREDCKVGLRDASIQAEIQAGTGTEIQAEGEPFGTITGTNDDGTVRVEVGNKPKCETMKAVESLSLEDSVRFDPNTVNINAELQSSSENNNMSSSAGEVMKPGVESETEIKYPKSGRVIKKDGRGNIISDTQAEQQQQQQSGEQPKQEQTTTTTSTTAKNEGKVVDSEGKEVAKKQTEEKTVEKEITKEEPKLEEQKKEEPKKEESNLEQEAKGYQEELKSKDRVVERLQKDVKFLKRQLIENKVNSAAWLKPEQKEERIEKYSKMEVSIEDLAAFLEDAFGQQIAVAKQVNREKTSSVEQLQQQYHEDPEQASSSNQTKSSNSNSNNKLTLDLIRPRK